MSELLAVIAIMVLMMAFVGPVIRGLKGSRDIVSNTYNIAGTLEQARAFAMANNTYTWVGFFEEDGAAPSPTALTTNGAAAGVGRVVTCIFASKDGQRYTGTNPTHLAVTATNIAVVGNVRKYEGTHLVTSADNLTAAPAASRDSFGPQISTNGTEIAPLSTSIAAEAKYPVAGTTANYKFKRFVEFNPYGEANLLDRAVVDFPPAQWIGLGLRRANGQAPDPNPVANIFVEGLTGRVHVFLP